jgi:hypothetical protein
VNTIAVGVSHSGRPWVKLGGCISEVRSTLRVIAFLYHENHLRIEARQSEKLWRSAGARRASSNKTDNGFGSIYIMFPDEANLSSWSIVQCLVELDVMRWLED